MQRNTGKKDHYDWDKDKNITKEALANLFLSTRILTKITCYPQHPRNIFLCLCWRITEPILLPVTTACEKNYVKENSSQSFVDAFDSHEIWVQFHCDNLTI